MAKRNNRGRTLVPHARLALDQMKYEIANELNVPTHLIQGDYWGNLTSRDCGSVGGGMVKRMIEAAEQSLVATTAAGVRHGFHQELGGWVGHASTTSNVGWSGLHSSPEANGSISVGDLSNFGDVGASATSNAWDSSHGFQQSVQAYPSVQPGMTSPSNPPGTPV